ncbi:hypothetical protein DDZ18_04440 [Marinicauda salina]|uniref:ABC transporter domain-containing protein n=1 Tax=Marinicauda salina TaxID=2135793 RepID=A0A2U2BXU2_9PROT|nr:ABC transporter ATP-binding protein [Marinicauda salina]PWE18843.1 hypothetical protein DDZ18_04440 [Marinicauda salina]
MSVLELDTVSVDLGGRRVLDGVSFSVGPGECVALVGPNGAGKSTAIRAALGLVPLAEGEARLGGASVSSLDPRERGRRASYLPQARDTAWAIRARDLAALGRFAWGGAPYDRLDADDRAAVDAALDRADAAALAGRRVDALSGGEQARVHLARALAARAPVLLADEPVTALDLRHQHDALAVLRGEAEAGRAVIAALHDLDAVLGWADRVIVLDGGRVAAEGPPEATLTDDLLAQVFAMKRADRGYTPA